MSKSYTAMSRSERRFHDVCRHVCLPLHQTEIYNKLLNADERLVVEDGTRKDVSPIESKLGASKPANDKRSEFDWIYGNGRNNIARIAEHRNVDPRRLALDFALVLGLLRGEIEYQQLVREFCGEDLEPSVPHVQIEYRHNKLFVNGELDAAFRVTATSRGDHIVKSFEESGWQKKEINVESAFEDRRALVDCLRNLNAKTKRIKFERVGDWSITWRLPDGIDETS